MCACHAKMLLATAAQNNSQHAHFVLMIYDQHYTHTRIHGPRCGGQNTVCKIRTVPTQLITTSASIVESYMLVASAICCEILCITPHTYGLEAASQAETANTRAIQGLT